MSSLTESYYPYHEADEGKTIEIIKGRFPIKESALKSLRKKRKPTQNQLALLSAVNLRSIRSYEQGENELLKAQRETLQRLATHHRGTFEIDDKGFYSVVILY